MTLKKADSSKKMLAKDLEGPAMRRKRVERDDMRRSLKAKYDKCCLDNLEEMLIKWQSKQMAMDDIVKKLEQEQAKIVDKEFKAAGADAGAGDSQLVLYVTNQTGNRHIRYRCNRLKLNFVCLRIQYTEIDVAGNKWLRDKVSREAKNDDLPLLFYGLGEGVWPVEHTRAAHRAHTHTHTG